MKPKRVKASPITGKHVGPSRGARIGPKHTKKIIRRHHTLLKRKAQIESELTQHGNTHDNVVKQDELAKINEEIYENGGIEKYQQASIAGQDPSRGGDSSKVLVDWLREQDEGGTTNQSHLRLLEVGSLSPDNIVSKCGLFSEIERIDLNSQHPSIRQQDFLDMAVPVKNDDKYDVISLSLVVNYVPEKEDRGKMLELTTRFLKPNSDSSGYYPCLFLVLPAPCVVNSRYFTEIRLNEIMECLGYKILKRKETPRIIYWLWRHEPGNKKLRSFKKQMLNDGKSRNNFCITIE